jgi:hypothetical protein
MLTDQYRKYQDSLDLKDAAIGIVLMVIVSLCVKACVSAIHRRAPLYAKVTELE